MSILIPQSETVEVDSLKVDNQNPNVMSKGQLERLKTSIEKYGFIVPIITNKDLLIADGEQRLTVAKQLGMKQVSVIRLPVEDVDRRLLRQVLNKLRGEHIYSFDIKEYEKIIEADGKEKLFDMLKGSDEHLARWLRLKDKPFEFERPLNNLTAIPIGTLIKFGINTLICQNAFETSFPSASLAFLDPPWDLAIPDEFIQRLINNTETVVLLHNDKTIAQKVVGFQNYFRYFLVFTRSTATITVKSMPLVHHILGAVFSKKPKFHKLTPPVSTVFTNYSTPFRHDKNPEVTKTLIEMYTDEGDMVIEPFSNKPTMLFICETLKRIYYGTEIDGKKCAMFKQLWENQHLKLAQIHEASSNAPQHLPASESIPTASSSPTLAPSNASNNYHNQHKQNLA